MAKSTDSAWMSCKVIEQEDNGQLVLLQDNLTKLLQHLNTKDVRKIPLTLISVIGPQSSGKSFLTNLLAEYLEHNGEGWADSLKENGLKGFACGTEDEYEGSEEIFVPDENRSGIYFWPKLFPLNHCNGSKLLLIMHLHHTKENYESLILEDDPLYKLLVATSSSLIDIIWKERAYSVTINENLPKSLKSDVHPEIAYLIRRITNSQQEQELTSSIDKDKIFTLNSLPAIEEKGKIILNSKQHRTLDRLVKYVLDPGRLNYKTYDNADLNISNIDSFLVHFVNSVNSNIKPENRKSRSINKKVDTFKENVAQELTTKHEEEEQEIEESTIDNQTFEEVSLAPKSYPQVSKESEPKIDLSQCLKKEKISKHDLPGKSVSDKLASVRRNFNIRSAWAELQKPFIAWIESSLRKENINEIESLYDTCLHQTVEQEANLLIKNCTISSGSKEEFMYFAKNEISKVCKAHFTKIQENIANFCTRTDVQFKQNSYFPPDHLNQNLNMTLKKILALSEDDILTEATKTACLKLFHYYEAYNAAKLQENTKILNEYAQKIHSFYVKEMQDVIDSSSYYASEILLKISNRLITKLKVAYEEIIDNSDQMQAHLNSLEEQLVKEFEKFRKKNLDKIETIQKSVSSLLTKLKGDYEVQMDNYIQDNDKTLSVTEFKKEHNSIEATLLTHFKTEITQLISNRDEIKVHQKTLQSHFEKSRQLFEDENEELFENPKPSPKPDIKKDVPQSQDFARAVGVPSAFQKHLDPLLFHLALNSISIGIFQDNDINITYYSAEVAQTINGEVIYGDEIRKSTSSLGNAYIKKSWCLNQCFAISPQQLGVGYVPWTDEIDGIKITAEFVLALLLDSLKKNIEKEQNGVIPSLLVGVPFWFPSLQRQQVIDAGKIAGFDEIKIISENSAAAYFMYSSNLHESIYDTVVISESSHMVDITLYSYNPGKKKLTMLGHSGDYESNRCDQNRSWFGILKRLWNKFYDYGEEDKAIRELVTLFTSATTKAEKQHFSIMSKKHKILIRCESNSWVDILSKVAKKASGENISVNNDATMHGLAAMYRICSSNLSKLDDIIVDGMPFYVNIYLPMPHVDRQVALKNLEAFSAVPKRKLKGIMVACTGDYFICQENCSGKYTVGILTTHKRDNEYKKLDITLHRTTSENIISLYNVEWTHASFTNIITRKKLENSDYIWNPCTLSSREIEFFSKLLHKMSNANKEEEEKAKKEAEEKMQKEAEEKAREHKKQMAIEKGELLQQLISNGSGTFQGDIVKSLIIKQLKDATESIKHHKIAEDEIQMKTALLDSISKTYKIT